MHICNTVYSSKWKKLNVKKAEKLNKFKLIRKSLSSQSRLWRVINVSRFSGAGPLLCSMLIVMLSGQPHSCPLLAQTGPQALTYHILSDCASGKNHSVRIES